MAGAGITGKFGDVKIGSTQICEVTKWSFEPKTQIFAYASNKTGQYKRKVTGPVEGSGSIEGTYDPANPVMTFIDVASSYTLKLYLNATVFYSVPAIIESLKMDVDIDSGDFIKWSASFQSDGAYVNPIAGLHVPEPDEEDQPSPETQPRTRRRSTTPVQPDRELVPAAAEDETQGTKLSQDDIVNMVHAQLTMAKQEILTTVSQMMVQILREHLGEPKQAAASEPMAHAA